MRAADADILIVPGWHGSGPTHWQSRWEAKLSSARRVRQTDWARPRLGAWEETLAQAIAECRRPVVIVAHSLGVATTLHAARRAAETIAGAFLVAPPSELAVRELPDVDAAFLPYPRGRLPFPAVLVGSATDPYADPGFARMLSDDLGARFIDAGDSGHINVESGHGPWPEGSLAFAHFIAKL
jgi:predicted alpha/beta hydrolase family esterase